MNINQKSITISNLNPEIIQKINLYINSRTSSKNESLKNILKYGLAVVNGEYHDQELNKLSNQLNSVINGINYISAGQKITNSELSDIQDSITQQISDTDLLIQPTTNKNNRKEQ